MSVFHGLLDLRRIFIKVRFFLILNLPSKASGKIAFLKLHWEAVVFMSSIEKLPWIYLRDINLGLCLSFLNLEVNLNIRSQFLLFLKDLE